MTAWLAVPGTVAVTFTAVLVARGVSSSATPAESYVTTQPRTPGTVLPVLFRAPAMDLSDARGARVTTQGLAGSVWIATFIYTRCTSVCPALTARVVQLQHRVRSPAVQFVSISVDPDHDNPAALAAYVRHWPDDPRWHVVSTTRAQLDEVARGFRVAVAPTDDRANPILHSRLVTLVDGQGRVRGVYDGDDGTAWPRIAADADELAHGLTHGVTRSTNATGSPLVRFGCTGCHDRPEVAPPLVGGTRQVTLATGETVAADEPYLRESLVRPWARVVAGYAPIMPTYEGMLTPAEITTVVDALRALPPPPTLEGIAATAAAGGPAVDPVCHMQVATVDAALSLTVDGRAEHFCSTACRDRYRAEHPVAR